jgi:hypothetical protein
LVGSSILSPGTSKINGFSHFSRCQSSQKLAWEAYGKMPLRCPPLAAFPRRFPPPWSVEETHACFTVRDANGQALAYVYFEDEEGRRATAKRRRFDGISTARA